MMHSLLRVYGVVMLMAMPASARTDEMFTVAASSHVVLGDEGGDTFGMEPPTKDQVMILLNPAGEDCTLRFPLRKGETFQLRVRSGINQTLGCEVALSATARNKSATFVSRCVELATFGERRCPEAAP